MNDCIVLMATSFTHSQVLEVVSKLQGKSVQEMAEIVYTNTTNLFKF